MTDIDWSDCSIVERNPGKLGGVPTVRSYRVPADAVVENHDDSLPDDEIAYQFSLPIENVRTILAFAQHPPGACESFLDNSVPADLRHHLKHHEVATAPNSDGSGCRFGLPDSYAFVPVPLPLKPKYWR